MFSLFDAIFIFIFGIFSFLGPKIFPFIAEWLLKDQDILAKLYRKAMSFGWILGGLVILMLIISKFIDSQPTSWPIFILVCAGFVFIFLHSLWLKKQIKLRYQA